MFLVPSGFLHSFPPIAGVRHSQSAKVELKSLLEVINPMLILKLCRVTLGLVLERVSFMRPGVACSPQPSTTWETDASETVQMLEVQLGGVCACAGPASSRKHSIVAAARAVSLAVGRGGGYFREFHGLLL